MAPNSGLMNESEQKHCSGCGVDKPVGEFRPKKARCRECRNEYKRSAYRRDPARHNARVRSYRERNPEKVAAFTRRHLDESREERRQYSKERYQRLMAQIEALKDVPCKDCGNKFPPECMDFDHVRGDKLGNIGQVMFRRAEVLFEELRKTEVVCACCHRIRTRKRQAGEAV